VALAIAAGAGAALTRQHVSLSGGVAAANHCTRYAPAISQDFNCNLKGSMTSSGSYQTPSTALRNSNHIDLNSSRNWTVCYVNEPNGCASGTGTLGSQGGSDTYRAAWCAFAGSAVTGLCETDWHD
jgi:hypothetical protein